MKRAEPYQNAEAPAAASGGPDAPSESAAGAAQPSPAANWGNLSLLRYAPALVAVAAAVADAGRFADTDLWGHIYFGNAVIRAGHFINHDPYNYSAPGHYWMNHEWLARAIMARAYDYFGIIGLKLWRLSLSTVTIFFLAAALGETGAPVALQAGVLLATAFALIPVIQFRPQVFSYALFAILTALLARDNFRRRAHLWSAIPLLALWSNLHGGFFIGLVVLALYTGVSGLQDLAAGRGIGRGLRLVAITAAAAAATLLNPLGLESWRAVIDSLANPMTRQVIADWRPLLAVVAGSRGPHSGILFLLMVLAIIAALALSVIAAPRAGDGALVAIAGVMSAAAFTAVRNMPLAVLAAAPPLARHLGIALAELRHRRGKASSGARVEAERMSGLGQGIMLVTTAVLLLGKGGLLARKLPAATDYPVGAIEFMQAHQLHGNILNDFEWGQYLIWHLAPESKIFIDGRFDLVYPPSVVKDYIAFFFGKPGGERALEAYPNDFVLMPPGSAAFATTSARRDWKLLYRDQKSALFARADSPAAAMAGVPVAGVAPESYFP